MTADLRQKINTRVAELHATQSRLRAERSERQSALERQSRLKEASSLAQAVAKAVQEEAHAKLAEVVTRSLAAVFDTPYTFQIKFESKRGRTEASLVFERDGVEVDPMTAAGGGVVDVAAFAMRLSSLLISRPPLRPVVFLDEPLKFLSAEYRDRAKVLIEMLAKELGIQFVMVTHLPELRCGKVIHL